MKELFAKTRRGSIHVGNEETFAKLRALAAEIAKVDQSLGWEVRALVVLGTEIAGFKSGKNEIDKAADALLDVGGLLAFHADMPLADAIEYVRETFDMAEQTQLQANGGVH